MKAILACAVAAILLSGCIVYDGGWHHHPPGVVVY
jgi:hypothetical protein